MMQFKIDGEELELKSGLSLTLKKTNSLLAFDNIACERTDSFQIPATPRNTRLLNVAQDVHWYGTYMRNRVEAQMVDGTIVQDGYLYIDSFESGVFNAIFVCGENITLKRLKELGNLSEYIWHGISLPPRRDWKLPFDTSVQDWGVGLYYNTWLGGIYAPSWDAIMPYTRLGYLLTRSAAGAGVTLNNVPSVLSNILILQPKLYASGGVEMDNALWNTNEVAEMRYNVPEWDFIYLLKLCAAVSGTLLKVENGAVTFFSANAGSFITQDITDKIIKYGKMERKVDGFGQDNVLHFANYGDEIKGINGLKDAYGVIEIYEVDNVNVEEEKSLLKTDGLVSPNYFQNYDNCIFPLGSVESKVDGSSVVYTYKMNESDYMIATPVTTAQCAISSHNGKVGLSHFVYQGGGGADWMQSVCDASTKAIVEVRMSRLEYEGIKPETLFHLNGTDYTWKSIEWSDNISTITLQKVGQ